MQSEIQLSDQCRIRTDYQEERLDFLTINDVLRTRAEKIGDQPYLFYGPESEMLTYAEVNETANVIANTLVEWGVEPNDNVGVMMQNPLDTALAMFGIIRAGAVYCPVNAQYKGEVLSYQINDTNPEWFFIEDQFIDRLNDVSDDLETTPTAIISETENRSENLIEEVDKRDYDTALTGETVDPDINQHWDDNAVMVYTSGTTGRPKGCMWSHRVMLYNISLFFGQALDEGDVAHSPLPMYHMSGIGPCIYLMVAGGSVALWDKFSPNEFWDRVDKYEATYTVLISVMIDWLRNQPETDEDKENTLKLVSMQPLPEDLNAFAERFSFDFVPVGFGMTEAGTPISGLIHAAQGEHATPEPYRRGSEVSDVLEAAERLDYQVLEEFPGDGFIGTPISCKAEAAILSEDDEELPPEKIGQLALRPTRPKVFMNGYYDDPDKTAEAYANLWFHTGDAAYRDKEGRFYFVDRMEGLIRRRGENISSIQIEEQINKHQSVANTTVFPVPSPEGAEDEIVTAVEVENTGSITENEIKDFLENKLPEFMRPRYYIVEESLPKTETNKIKGYEIREEFIESHPEIPEE